MAFTDWLRIVILGIIQGITEWLPVSSTGHLVILQEFWKGSETVFTEDFEKMFDVLIQLGSVLAVVSLYFNKLNPFSECKSKEQKKNTWLLWSKIVVATLPAVFFGLVIDDFMEKNLYRWYVVAASLIIVGVFFVFYEKYRKKDPSILRFSQLNYKTALFIGLFQVLAMVPGVSRSGITILSALLLGCSVYIATEFSFFMSIPVIFGAGVLKLFKYIFIKNLVLTGVQWAAILAAGLVSYVVSVIVVKYFVKFLRKHDLTPFGYYRIVLGVLILIIFLVK